jgi:hypothetical protein
MPMSRRILIKKIDELKEKAESNPDGRLSRANEMILKMFQIQVEFNGEDQILVVQAAGVVTGVSKKAHIVEVTASRAAEMLSNPNGQGALVRLADDDEVRAYRTYNDALTARAKQKISDDQLAIMRAQLHSLLGVAAPGGAAATEDLKPPTPAPMKAEPDEPGPASVPGVTTAGVSAEPAEPETATLLTESVTELLRGDQEENLLAAGFDTMEKLAEADPKAIANAVDGVGPSTAAKLIAEAAVGLSDEPATSDDDPE